MQSAPNIDSQLDSHKKYRVRPSMRFHKNKWSRQSVPYITENLKLKFLIEIKLIYDGAIKGITSCLA